MYNKSILKKPLSLRTEEEMEYIYRERERDYI